ncbi:MAG: hypothetical protein QMD00_06010, partial [Hadesarchaea archaeon]|nr:hypothetical protein [Hadesarchaea archaeon]
MKEKLALVIAALMITSMALSISTTTVSAPSTFSASPGAALEPTRVKAGTRVMLTVKVTNETTENIDNVRIWALAGTFTEQIGGVSAAENLKLAADNMENAVAPLRQAGENLKLAGDNKKASGKPLKEAADDLYMAGGYVKGITRGTNATVDYASVGADLQSAKAKLEAAGDVIDDVPENFVDIRTKLYDAGTLINTAGTKFDTEPEENFSEYPNRERVAENLKLAGTALQNAADQLLAGSLRQAGTQLQTAASRIYDAAMQWGVDTNDNAKAAANKLDNYVDDCLNTAGQKLINAAQYDNLAGQNLVSVADRLQSVASYLRAADSDLNTAGNNLDLDPAADNLDAASSIRRAGENLKASTDNVLQAGLQLSQAADNLRAAATALGAALGGDGLTNATADENAAAENLRNREKVNLTAAGDALIAAASDLSAAASTMLSTAKALVPATCTMVDVTNGVQFNSIGENYLRPGASENYGFLLTTPTINTENDYTIRVASCAVGTTTWITQADLTLTVDGKAPVLTIVITQAGVAENNLVGTVYNNAKATITITSDEILQSIGTATVMDNTTGENLLPPLTIGMVKVLENTGTFTVGRWDDNHMIVRVVNAVDVVGNALSRAEVAFTVDTRAPIFVPPENSGLPGLISGMVAKTQAGTGITFPYVDNVATKNVTIRVEDNVPGVTDNAKYVIKVTIDTVDALRDAVVSNLWGSGI